jgi:hypothetical protein
MAWLLVLLLAFGVVAASSVCPPDTEPCVGGAVHALLLMSVGVTLVFTPMDDRLRPALAPVYSSLAVDPTVPPPRG